MARRNKQNEDDSQEDQENINNESDDTFGLPEVQYEPIKRDEPVYEEQNPDPEPEPVEERYEVREEVVESYREETDTHHTHDDTDDHSSGYVYRNQEEPSQWPKIVGILVFLLIAAGAIYYFAIYQPQQREAEANRIKEKARLERLANEEKERQRIEEENRLAAQRRADSLAAIPKVGSVERLSGRTGQYYVVAASAVDDDLLMDYAAKLVKQGKQVRIIPPFGKAKVHRLAIEAKETYADAQATADAMKGGDFGDKLWVLRY